MKYAKVSKKCCICGKTFYVSPSRENKAKYCSKDCWNSRWCIMNKCLECWNEIKTYKSVNKVYCWNQCRDKHYRERFKWENCHFREWWKTKESKLRKTCAEYKEWRMKIFERDGYRCVICWVNDRTLEADHIKPQSEYPDLIYDINNWRTLCHQCHKKTNTYWPKQQKRMKTLSTYK